MRTVAALMAWALLVPAAGRSEEDRRALELKLRAESAEAYRAGDHARFLELSRSLVALAPRSVRATYNLACAEALSGNPAAALSVLEGLAARGASFDIAADDDLASLRDTERYRILVARMAELREPIARAEVAFTLSEKDLLTEGLARDPRSGDFFVGSVHRRKIVRVGADGKVTDFTAEGQDGLLAVFGLAVDAGRRALWGATDTIAQMRGAAGLPEGTRGFVFEYDIDTGALRRRLGPPAEAPDARFADLSLGPGGTVYASDPYNGRVYVLRAGETKLRVLVPSGTLVSPQGLAPTTDGRAVVVADYARGLAKLDTGTGAVAWLGWPDDAVLTGIDGLVWAGDALVAVQNGLAPHRLLRLAVDPELRRVAVATVLERARPDWDEPTLAVVVGNDVYYVGTSQWGRFGDDGSVDEAKLRPPVVLRLALD